MKRHSISFVLASLAVVATLGMGWPNAAQADLIAYWSFDEGTGTAVADSSGNSQNAALGGGTLPSWISGKFGYAGDYALNFPAYPSPTSYVLRPAAVSNLGGATNFTITYWARERGTDYYGHTIVAGSTTSGGSRNWMEQNGSGGDQQMYFGYNNGNFLSTGRNLPTNVWTLVTATYDNAGGATRTKIYLNDAQTNHNWGVSFPTHLSFFIGGWTATGSNFIGDMDDVSVWNETLSAGKAKSMYNILSPNSGALFDYKVDKMKVLFDVYKDSIPRAVTSNAGTLTWSKFTGVTGTAGTVTYDAPSQTYRAFFDDNMGVEGVPEPGTLVLLATGLLGLAACVWRRRRA